MSKSPMPDPSDRPAAGSVRSTANAMPESLRLAYERTILAWVRTALALIGFGFTIAQIFDYLHSRSDAARPLLSPQAVGMTMIGLGLISTIIALLQFRRAKRAYPGTPPSEAAILAAIVCMLGIAAMIGVIVRG